MKTKANEWVQFTKRTDDPKLKWLETALARAGISSRRHGYSWHAPILQVHQKDLRAAWEILRPIDDIVDDDPRWEKGFDVNPSGRAGSSQWAIGK